MQESRSQAKVPSIRGRAWRALLEGSRDLLRTLDRQLLEGVGLDLRYYDVLLHVAEGEGGRRMTELADAIILSKSGLTSLVDRMEREGLLERRPDPTDRRAILVTLTAHGADRFREASQRHRTLVRQMFTSRVSDEEAAVIVEVLERVRREATERTA